MSSESIVKSLGNKKILLWIFGLVLLSSLVFANDVSDPYVYYSFDDGNYSGNDIYDLSGNLNNATNNGGTLGGSGVVNQGIDFGPSNSFIYDTLALGTTFTASFWISFDDGLGATRKVIGYDGNSFLFEKYTDNKIRSYFNGGDCYSDAVAWSYDNWEYVTIVRDGTALSYYINGTAAGTCVTSSNSYTNYEIGRIGGTAEFDGQMDEFVFYNYSLNATEVETLYNASGNPTNVTPPVPPVTYLFNVTLLTPVNDTITNNDSINFTYNVSISNGTISYCDLMINGTNVSEDNSVAVNSSDSFNYSLVEGDNNWTVECVADNGSITTADNFTIIKDFTYPTINYSGIYQNLRAIYFLNAQFNFSDENLYSINITDDVTGTIFNITNISDTTYNYTLDHNISSYDVGEHTLNVKVADGHTAEKINKYNIDDDWFDNGLKFTFDDRDGWITINPEGLTGKLKTKKKWDRYSFEYDKGWFEDLQVKTFYVKSSHYIDIVRPSKYEGHLVINGLDKWIDFEEIDGNLADVTRISGTEIKIEVKPNKKDKDKLIFNSIGDLNVVELNFTWYKVNVTDTYDSVIFDGFDTDYILELNGNFTGLTPNVTLNLNGSTYSPNLVFGSNSTYKQYLYNYNVNEGVTNSTTQWYHNWTVDLNYTNVTPTQSQKIYEILLGPCSSTLDNVILNISYFDETNSSAISVDNTYVLNFTDGTYYYNKIGVFLNNLTSQFCTNIDPSDATYTWDMYNSFTLSKSGYVTRVVDIDPSLPIEVSNNPQSELSLYMILTNASTTVTINWLSTDYQIVEGTMRVYRCEADGNSSLIESTPIIAGKSYANLELLTQAYKYEVISDENLYTNPSTYSKCHVEYVDDVTYYIDLNPSSTKEFLGLLGVTCTLEEIANHTIQMTWEQNEEDSSYVQGCIVGNRHTINGLTEVYNNCSDESDGYSRIVTVPVQNVYTVSAYITQNGYEIACGDNIVIDYDTAPGGIFGPDSLFAVILLIICLALIYIGDGEAQLYGAAIGVIASWVIGILIFESILIVTTIVMFLGLLALIGRYTRK